MGLYQSSGDLVKIPQNTTLMKRGILDKDYPFHGCITAINNTLKYGLIVESFTEQDTLYYEMLVGEEYWCAKAEEVFWAGA